MRNERKSSLRLFQVIYTSLHWSDHTEQMLNIGEQEFIQADNYVRTCNYAKDCIMQFLKVAGITPN